MPSSGGMFNIKQDWEPVVIRKAPPKSAGGNKQASVNKVLQAGGSVQTEAKFGGAGNAQKGGGASLYARKLDDESDNLKHKTVNTDVKSAIAKGRTAKGWKQSDLAQQINERPQIVQEYESGKAIPNPQVLGKMEKALGVKLRGKDIGQPIVKPEPKAKAEPKGKGKK